MRLTWARTICFTLFLFRKWSIIKWFAVGSWPDDRFSFWLCGQFYTLKGVYWTERCMDTAEVSAKIMVRFRKPRIFDSAFHLDGWCIVCPSKSIDHAEPAFPTIRIKLLFVLFAPRTYKFNSIQWACVNRWSCHFGIFTAHSSFAHAQTGKKVPHKYRQPTGFNIG